MKSIDASGPLSPKVIKDSKKIEKNSKKHDNWFWGKDPEATIHDGFLFIANIHGHIFSCYKTKN